MNFCSYGGQIKSFMIFIYTNLSLEIAFSYGLSSFFFEEYNIVARHHMYIF